MAEAINKAAKGARMYFIAVVLPPQLDEKVLAYKKQMHELYGCKVGLKSPAHITVVPPYWMEEAKESLLRDDMEKIAQDFSSFHLATNDFSAFKPRTIFIALQESDSLIALKKNADAFFRHPTYKIKIDTRPFHPHITIATRDLNKKDFAEAWPRFEKENFRESFEAKGLSLLKHNGKTWDVVFTAPFNAPAPTETATQP